MQHNFIMNSKLHRYFALLILQTTLCAAFEIQYQCNVDSDCGQGSFCHNFLCERCIPCEQLFNRFSPFRNNCAKFEDDCGRCLPGYQAEDLTSQRRSMKCFPTAIPPPFIEKPTFLPPSDLIYGAIGLIVITVVVFVIVIMGAFIRAKNHLASPMQNTIDQSPQQKLIEDDRLPPPYESSHSSESVGLPRTSQYSYTLVFPEQDILNHAAPFEPYHNHKRQSVDFETDLHVADDSTSALEDGTGSTETIPSLWEPSTVDELSAPEQTTESSQRNILVRSYSFDSSSRLIGTSQNSESRSDSALNGRGIAGGQSYAHRHVQLSMYRSFLRNVSSTGSRTNSGWNSDINISQEVCYADANVEPNAPQSFVFDDSPAIEGEAGVPNSDFLTRSLQFFLAQTPLNASLSENAGERDRGSQDSGFFDHARRRPATEELEFGVAFYIKKSRQVD